MKQSFVELLINRFLVEMKKNDRSGIYALTQRFLAYNSNRIEGSTLTEDQTASLFETGTLTSSGEIVRAKDIEEMTGHFLMFNEMLKSYNEPLSHELIKRYHYKLKSGVFEDLANGYPIGEYKNRKNFVSNIATALPSEVTDQMSLLLTEYNKRENHSLEEIARFHANYERIHPFQDGNGRTGRIILFKECLKNNLVPFVIDDKDKAKYYKALNDAQNNGDFKQLCDFFENEQKVFYEIAKDFIISYNEMNEPLDDRIEEIENNKESSVNKIKQIDKEEKER